MKPLSPGYLAAIAKTGTTLCNLWTLTLKNGDVFRLTDHDADVTFGGEVYEARTGFELSAVRTTLNEGVASSTVSITIADTSVITEANARRGILNEARLVIFEVDYTDPDAGKLDILGGLVGRQSFTDRGRLDLDIDGSFAAANRQIGEVYSQTCRNQFGDHQCRYPVDTLRRTFTVTSMSEGNHAFTAIEALAVADYWNFGTVTFTTGDNRGTTHDITQSTADGIVRLGIAPGFEIVPGDTGTIAPGCSKFRNMCADRWNNVLNIRAEPDAPTPDDMTVAPPTPTAFPDPTTQGGGAGFPAYAPTTPPLGFP